MSKDYSYIIAGGQTRVVPGRTHTYQEVFRRVESRWGEFAAENRGKTAAEQVLAFMDIRNQTLRADAAFLAGSSVQIGIDDGMGRSELAHLDHARAQVIQYVESELRKASARGQDWPKTPGFPQDAASVLYALVRSYNGRSEYASLAERETGAYLSMLADKFGLRDFFDITAMSRKSVTQPGPDGIFAGAASLFGLSREFVGLEVKTIVSDSFGSVMSALKVRTTENPADFRLDTQKRGKARLNVIIEQHPNPVERQRAAVLLAQLERSPAEKIGTMLVVRNVGFTPMKIDEWAYKTFDVVLVFDLWGRLEEEKSRRQTRRIRDLMPRLQVESNAWLAQRARIYMQQIGMDLQQLAP